ncbi:FHA domain-containing protein, partial [Streptomyces sp. W16]|uniref:FHA domain-containing protein n=1 Tax=Streptomyces sp. W16 TaxID=3076631 RepID=UPI00295BECB6
FNAHRDRVPLVIVAGQQARSLLQLRPFLGADRPAEFPRPYVKFAHQPERAADVPAVLAEAHRIAMTPPRGPVFVSVPEDDWDQPARPVEPRTVHTGFTADPQALSALAARLDDCARPALVVGPGVDDEDALPEARDLAERTRAAVWISPLSGRSGFPESHPLFQGFLPPLAGQLAARLRPYDVVVALGAPVFTYHVDDGGPLLHPGTELHHLDCDPAQAAWLPTGTSIVTTLKPALTHLTALLKASDRVPPPPRPAYQQQPTTWLATIGPDREYFLAMMQRSGPEAAGLNLPAYSPEQQRQLIGNQITIGRRRHSTGESPDIDLSVPPEDPGVSHQHAVLVQQPDGSWAVVDQNSTNGTTVNGGEEPIQPFVPVPLQDGDRVHVGAWTTITVRRG